MKLNFFSPGLIAFGLSSLLIGCAPLRHFTKAPLPCPRAFDVGTDTLAAPLTDPSSASNREPQAGADLRGHAEAFVTRQFFLHARFEPTEKPPTTQARVALVREILRRDPKQVSSVDQRVVVPGYANLREFSAYQGHLLRTEAWLVCPAEARATLGAKAFGNDWQKNRLIEELLAASATQRPSLVHLYRLHALRYDRALLITGAETAGLDVRFTAFAPGAAEPKVQLTYHRATRSFTIFDDAAPNPAPLGVELWPR